MTIKGEISGHFNWNSAAVARVGFRTNRLRGAPMDGEF